MTTTTTSTAPAPAPCGCPPPPARDYTGMTRTRNGQLRDSQRSKVYAWQWADDRYTANRGEWTLDQAQAFVDQMADDYGLPRIPVKHRPGGGSAYFQWSNRPGTTGVKMTTGGYSEGGYHYPPMEFRCYITAPDWAKNRYTLVHEFAHYLTHYRYGLGETPGHGQEFTAAFIELLARYTEMTEDELRRRARRMNVKVAAATRCDHQDEDNEEAPTPAPAPENPPAPAPATTTTRGGQQAWAI